MAAVHGSIGPFESSSEDWTSYTWSRLSQLIRHIYWISDSVVARSAPFISSGLDFKLDSTLYRFLSSAITSHVGGGK